MDVSMDSIVATIKLFNGVVVPDNYINKKSFNFDTLQKGYLLDSAISFYYNKTDIQTIRETVEQEIAVSYTEWNNAFYKSWEKLQRLSDLQIRLDQLLHYFTTYGVEALEVDFPFVKIDFPFVYFPSRVKDIELPGSENVPFLLIKGMTREEIKEKLTELVSSGIALKGETQDLILSAMSFFSEEEKKSIVINNKNKELGVRIADRYGFYPFNPAEFLRYVIFKLTGSSLLIKNKKVIEKIKISIACETVDLYSFFEKYSKLYGYKKLSEVFFRFKPLFLAFKADRKMKPIINHIRKLADRYHKPMVEDYLNTITRRLKQNKEINYGMFTRNLSRVNNFRKIRLLYALKNMFSEDVVYTIRNGNSYATTRKVNTDGRVRGWQQLIYADIQEDIVASVQDKIKDLKFYLPENVFYALPSSEKQFVGNFPSKTYIQTNTPIVAGIHWENLKDTRIDLDLSVTSIGGEKYGWDGRFREQGASSTVFYSGDVTDAPSPMGGSEFFYFNNLKEGLYLMQVNFFNSGEPNFTIPFDFVLGQSDSPDCVNNQKYLLNPNKILVQSPMSIGPQELVLGLVKIENEQIVFYFMEGKSAIRVSAKSQEETKIRLRFLEESLKNSIGFSEIIEEAGGVLVEEEEDCDINLSPNKIDKGTIINLFK